MTESTQAPTPDAESAGIKPDVQARLNAVPVTEDVVAYMLGCWLAVAPRTSMAMVHAVEQQVRHTFGGDEVWIAKGQNKLLAQLRAERDERIRRDYLAGERLELLERRYELTKRRLFQIVKS